MKDNGEGEIETIMYGGHLFYAWDLITLHTCKMAAILGGVVDENLTS